jgi:hypothetical protein
MMDLAAMIAGGRIVRGKLLPGFRWRPGTQPVPEGN